MTEMSVSTAEKPKPVPFRITVGVTGHRKLNDSRQLRENIGRVLDHVSRRYHRQGAVDVRFCALTPLAEGADCIVAEEILSLNKYPDPTIKAVLPLTVDEYRKDFTSAEAREAFENLMDKAQVVLTLRDTSVEEEYGDLSPDEESIKKARRQAYEDVGRFVVDHCDVLIAIWDGEPARGKGGTGDAVLYARRSGCPFYIINPASPEAIQYCGDKNENTTFKRLDRCKAAISEFNRQLQTFEDYTPYVDSMYRDLFLAPPDDINDAVGDDTKNTVRNRLMPYYAMASSTAKWYQRIYRYVGLTVFWLAFAAVFTIGVGAIFFHSEPVFFVIELCLLIAISLLIHYADRVIRSHKKWMQYRFLTERIRTAFFLVCCGKRLQPFHFPRRSGGKDNPDVWMTMVFEEIWADLPALDKISEKNYERLGKFIRCRWIEDQLNFHSSTIQKNRQRSHSLERIGGYIFFAANGAAAVHLLFPLVFSSFHDWRFAHGLTLAALIFPALAATIEAIRSHREYKRLAIRSARISFELQRFKTRLNVLTPARLNRVVDDMTALMWSEGQEWLTMMGMAELHVVV